MPSSIKIKVRGYHLDGFGHVNHARYVELMEEARWDYFDVHEDIKNVLHKQGIGHATVNINISYRNEARLADILRIETSVKSATRNSMTFEQKIYLGASDKVVAEASVTNVFFRMSNREVVPMSDEVFMTWGDLVNVLPEAG
jgi:thioesterase-3